ncbi:kinase-like domain-containing protein [Radiomyces spectabilis]|uniref:kinase-like domain-containing protein n=1 Tax=Radiomyces spectabilis TaxID=64574 RepID=UPI00221FEBAD|nr:kinase-like domain-containing protein [Radiomyces spectabilis]KAI8381463.1 kinase-like domain-containing protein [Radiomyces spectabilis]
MYSYSYRKQQPYQAGLATSNPPPSSIDVMPSFRGGASVPLSKKHAQPSPSSWLTNKPYVRQTVNRKGRPSAEKEHDWDSDPELEYATVQEAVHVSRQTPAKVQHKASNSAPSSSSSTHSRHNGPRHPESPFYSQVVEPVLNLGDKWTFSRNTPVKKFRKVTQRETLIGRPIPDQNRKRLLHALTMQLAHTYSKQNLRFQYDAHRNPKRVLTKPSKPAKNDGFDNEDYDYILRVNDILGDEKDYQYRVIDLLGQGTFGQVVKCVRVSTGELFSLKIIKNKPAYRAQSRMEVEILKQLNLKIDPQDQHRILKLHRTFNHKNHLCLVFELLSYNLYELIKQNGFKGLSLSLVRVFALQLLDTLVLLKEAKIIHCDLKPENILLQNVDSPTIKVIDFGSACHEANRIYTYIQSRFYRSPEVLLGLTYTGAIDMWSLGCIIAELFLGLPLFPGSSEYNQLRRIIDMMGLPPQDMLDKGKSTLEFFNREDHGNGKYVYKMKSREQYGQEQQKTELPGKKYFEQTELPDLILKYNSSRAQSWKNEKDRQRDLQTRYALIDFLQGVLELNPLRRWTPLQARCHPFITGEPFTEPYKPDARMKINGVRKEDAAPFHHQLTAANNELQEMPPSTHGVGGSTEQSIAMVDIPKPQDISTISVKHRSRAQSMGTQKAPAYMQGLVQDIQAHPIIDHKVKQSTQSAARTDERHAQDTVMVTDVATVSSYRQRHARSQGDSVGVFAPVIEETIRNSLLGTQGGLIMIQDEHATLPVAPTIKH